jgi:hypothetical protein
MLNTVSIPGSNAAQARRVFASKVYQTHLLQQVPHLDLHLFDHLAGIGDVRGTVLYGPVLLSLPHKRQLACAEDNCAFEMTLYIKA